MSIWDRPHAGNWRPNRRKTVRYTPDAVVFLNGDTSVPGNNPEHQVVDIQQYLTQVSVDAGTEAGSASASFTMSIPKQVGSRLFSDGHSVFQPGLEVHVYMRGYYAVDGLVNTLNKTELDALKSALGDDAANLALRPYYHCFHGISTTANLEYSGGMYSVNLSCAGMLHFWQYHDISTNASLFGTRPTGSKLKMSLVGHNFTNMTPFSIIYSLYKDTAGAAGGVAFALSANSNQSKKFFDSGSSLYEMSQMYWEKRFQSKVYNLRMFGVNGEQLNSAQTAMVGRMSTSQLNTAAEINARATRRRAHEAVEPLRADQQWDKPRQKDVKGTDYRYRSLSDAMLQWMPRAGEKSGYAVSAAQLKAFVNDIGQWGNVNLFESSYTSKLDIASAATQALGFEFFQDVDGDLVFKPPLYNLDTRGLEAYNIEPVDIISLTRASAEPQCTYMTVKSGAFSNWKGLGLEGEWGIRGQYIDYRLVAKYGWRPGDLDAQFYSDARGAFWAAVARMDVLNEAMETANITIPLRPELRPGFPVYVKHLDCFYYIKSMSHSFSYGGQCTTSLQCVAQRKKFLPPGNPALTNSTGSPLNNGMDAIQLSRPDLPGIPLVRKRPSTNEFYLSGFPNVVMALDPMAISPLVWAFGQDVADLGNVQSVRNLVMLLSGNNNKHPLAKPKGEKWNLNGTMVDTLIATDSSGGGGFSSAKAVDAWFNHGTQPGGGDAVIYIYSQREDSGSTTSVWSHLPLKLADIKKQLESYNEYMAKSAGSDNESGSQIKSDVTKKKAWEQSVKEYDEKMKAAVFGESYDLSKNATVFDLMTAVGAIQSAEVKIKPDKLDSAKILDFLGDKKANFSNASTPGYYRYYSSNHPTPEEQSPGSVSMTMTAQGSVKVDHAGHLTEDFSDGQFKLGALTPDTEIRSSKLRQRFVEFEVKPAAARTFRICGAGGRTEDVHTTEIRTLVFSRGPLNLAALVPRNLTKAPKATLGRKATKQYVDAMCALVNRMIGEIDLDATVGDTFEPVMQHFKSLSFPGAGKPWNDLFSPATKVSDAQDFTSSDEGFGDHGFSIPEFSWDVSKSEVVSYGKRWNPAYRLPVPDWDEEGKKLKNTSTFTLKDVKVGQVRRHLNCQGKISKYDHGCKCYKTKRGKPVHVSSSRSGELDTKRIVKDTLQEYLVRQFAKPLTLRLFKLLNISSEQWFHKYGDAMMASKAKLDADANLKKLHDEGKVEFMEFARFMNDLNDKLGIKYNKKIKVKKGRDGKFTGFYVNVWDPNRNPNYFKATGVHAKATNVMSPIFPISDSGGYRVYGSYAYGRGVTVGREGGWSTLMSLDPLEALDDSTVDAFVKSLLKEGGRKVAATSNFNEGSGSEDGMLEAIMKLQNEDPTAFANVLKILKVATVSDGGSPSETVSIEDYVKALGADKRPTLDKMKNLIGVGLINHFNRDDTPGTYTSPLNSAHSLADIMPGKTKSVDPTVGDEVLWDSMVRLAAGDENEFLLVMPEGADGKEQSNVSKIVQQQIVESTLSHYPIQDEYRGKRELPRTEVNWDAIADGWGEDSTFGEAVDKMKQWGRAWSGDKPDDPEIAAAFERLDSAEKQWRLSEAKRSSGLWDSTSDSTAAERQALVDGEIAKHTSPWNDDTGGGDAGLSGETDIDGGDE